MPIEILIVLALILLNGFFALSEMAVMTSRKTRLRQLAQTSKNAAAALALSEQPERFLSAVQVWITLIGILTGYFGGDAIALALQDEVEAVAIFAPYARGISVAVSVGIILLVSVVLGELVPKRLAIRKPEAVATVVALPMRILSTVAKPVVVFLAFCTESLLRLMRLSDASSDGDVTEEEIKMLVAEGAEQGVIDHAERNMVNRALTLSDRSIDSLMTPRTRIAWLDTTATLEDNLAVMRDRPFSRYPVKRGSEQDVVGIVQTKNLMDSLSGKPLELFRDLAPALFVPETARAAHLLEKFRDAETPIALVVDEYGEIQGLVSLNDVALAVLGRIAHSAEPGTSPIVQRADGSWLVDGAVAVDDLRELLATSVLPREVEQEYRTAAGMMMVQFGRIPRVGEYFSWRGFRFEVVDLDGARIDKILVSRTVPPEPDNM